VLQLFVVFLSGSVVLLADTIHNFGDAATARLRAEWARHHRPASIARAESERLQRRGPPICPGA
jgi:hypothetical protein